MAMSFTYPSLVQVIGSSTYTLSDQDRSPLTEAYEVIENTRRTAKGQRRRYFIAQKRTFSLSWSRLPGQTANTVDGGIGADPMKTMFDSETDTVTLRIKDRSGSNTDVSVHIVDFERELIYRYSDDHYYSVSITFEEV